MNEAIAIEAGEAADEAALRALLQACGLPIEDLDRVDLFLIARRGQALIGGIGLEQVGDVALLRSLAVAPQDRKHGLGRALCERMLAEAQARRLERVFLLTTNAQPFFRRIGFAEAPRETAPAAIRRTAQFRALCPGSATLMEREP